MYQRPHRGAPAIGGNRIRTEVLPNFGDYQQVNGRYRHNGEDLCACQGIKFEIRGISHGFSDKQRKEFKLGRRDARLTPAR